jgi:hypothetical protein
MPTLEQRAETFLMNSTNPVAKQLVRELLVVLAESKIAEYPTGQKDHAALLARLTDEQLACALMSLHWRWLDAGGLSHGRSGEATLLEAYRDLLDLPRPPGNVNEWPSGQELVREAKNRVRDRSLASPPAERAPERRVKCVTARCSSCGAYCDDIEWEYEDVPSPAPAPITPPAEQTEHE